MATEFWVWLGVVVFAVFLEIITQELVSVWFAFGAVIPFFLSIFKNVPLWVQIVVFVVVSLVLVCFVRKFAQKWFLKNSGAKTNADALIGKSSKLLVGITRDDNGAVRFNGVVWSVTTEDGSSIRAGKYVDIVRMEGNKFIVKLSEKQQTIQQDKEEK
ncbi:MAG: NfeD family protein [Clostridia bacterium]|nr:NfeD family protein [Clostridia bacterium]